MPVIRSRVALITAVSLSKPPWLAGAVFGGVMRVVMVRLLCRVSRRPRPATDAACRQLARASAVSGEPSQP